MQKSHLMSVSKYAKMKQSAFSKRTALHMAITVQKCYNMLEIVFPVPYISYKRSGQIGLYFSEREVDKI